MEMGRTTYRTGRGVEIGLVAAPAYVAATAALGMLSPAGLAVLVGLTVLVLIHEGGHLVAARRCGIGADEFFSGFGPVVLAWRTRSGLRVGLKAIPAGGYVKVRGMSGREEVAPEHEATTFRAASRGRRLAVVAAGPVVNVVFGFMLLLGASATEGEMSPLAAASDAWNLTSEVATGTVQGLGAVAGDLGGYGAAVVDPAGADEPPSRFLSPIGVAQVSTDLASQGPAVLIRLMAIASIGLGVMNALPFPPLDGGHAAVLGVESIAARVRRRPTLRLDTTNRVVAAVTAVTFILVVALGASALLMDLGSPVSLVGSG
jgi:membrane-associated protease RseP (regulator of RpoE activity)